MNASFGKLTPWFWLDTGYVVGDRLCIRWVVTDHVANPLSSPYVAGDLLLRPSSLASLCSRRFFLLAWFEQPWNERVPVFLGIWWQSDREMFNDQKYRRVKSLQPGWEITLLMQWRGSVLSKTICFLNPIISWVFKYPIMSQKNARVHSANPWDT